MGVIRPEILTWARETAGLSLEDAARAIGLKDAKGETGPERLAKIEHTGDLPRPLLLKIAKAYRLLSPVRNDRNSADSVDEPLAGMRYALYNSF